RAPTERFQLSRVVLQADVPIGQAHRGRHERRAQRERAVRDAARQPEADDARPVAVDDEQAEGRPHALLIGITTAGSVCSASALDMRQWPSCFAPASITTIGASMSPVTRAPGLISTRSLAMTSPSSSPRTTTVV